MFSRNQLVDTTKVKDDAHTVSFKVGRAILDAKDLKGVVQLPFRLYEARKIHLERQLEYEISQNLKKDDDITVAATYEKYGLKGLAVLSQICEFDKQKLARELIDFSSSFKDENRVLISMLALELDDSLPILRGAAWAGVHCKNLSIIKDVLNRIETGKHSNEKAYQKTYEQFTKKINIITRQQKDKPEIKNNESKLVEQLKNPLILGVKNLNLEIYLNKISKNEAFFKRLVKYLYLMGGVKGVKKGIDQIFISFDSKQRAFLYLKAGKFLNKISLNAEYDLAMLAIEANSHMSILRGALWASQRRGAFNKTAEIIERIEAQVPNKPSKKDSEFLDKIYKSPAYTLTVEKHIESYNNKNYVVEPIKNRVAYVLHNSLPFSSGGYATRGFGLSTALKDLNFQVYVINRPGFPLDLDTDLDPAEIGKISIISDIPHIRTFSPSRRNKRSYDYILEAANALEVKFREYRPEIVVAASNHITAIPALIAASRLGIPFIYEVRGFWEITRVSREPEFEHKASFKVQYLLEAMAAKKAHHVFTLTQPMKEELIARGINRNKITLLPNSCNPDDFIPRKRDKSLAQQLSIPDTVPVIGYIGTFVQYEGLENLVEACVILKNKGIEFRLLLVGNENASGTDRGPITEAIIQTAQANDMLDWVIMPGRVPHDQVSNYYSLIDITPFPRKPQPVCEMVSPMKPLEASAMKKAIVVSSVKALREMITHEKNGLVFEKGNILDLALNLERLIVDEDLRKELGENARVWVENERRWSITANKMKGVLTRVLEEYNNS